MRPKQDEGMHIGGSSAAAISARALRDTLRARGARLRTNGGRLNEGATRVLRKLEEVSQASGMHRAYLKTGKRVTMWDLVSDVDLVERGFVPTRHRACTVFSEEPVKQDRVTCWISEIDPLGELWIGEPLAS